MTDCDSGGGAVDFGERNWLRTTLQGTVICGIRIDAERRDPKLAPELTIRVSLDPMELSVSKAAVNLLQPSVGVAKVS